ncbi:unnamed protein product [marine sediment metagenome]|uniref:Uncharacterized protein n=1 Tax=marine sediment metagenome TaxID=412755 RepID=X0SV24_9ZZZZ
MIGFNGGGAGDCDYPEPAYDFELTQEDAPRDQGELFQGIPPGRPNAELLKWLARAEGLATVDDLLAWNHHNQGRGTCINGCGHRDNVGLMDGCRVWCPVCGVHTVCSAKDIGAGLTPGPVKFQYTDEGS